MWWDRDPSVSRRPSQPFRPLSPRLCSTRPPVRLFEPAPAPASIRFVKFTKRVSSIRLAYLVLWHRCVGTPCNGVVSSSLTSRFHQALGIYQAPHDVDHDLFGATTASGLIYLEIVSFDPFWHKMTPTANNTYDTNTKKASPWVPGHIGTWAHWAPWAGAGAGARAETVASKSKHKQAKTITSKQIQSRASKAST